MSELGRLQRVDLRNVWPEGGTAFAHWLVKPEHLVLLCDSLEAQVEVDEIDDATGFIRCDLFPINAVSGVRVVLGHELHESTGKMLSKLLTTASTTGADGMVWIASTFRSEHLATIEWLNRKTGEQSYFYGVAAEAWQIGDSPLAPRFNVQCGPAVWSKAVKAAQEENDSDFEENDLLYRYWHAFREYCDANSSIIRFEKVVPKPWMFLPKTSAYSLLGAFVNLRKQRIGVGVILKGADAAAHYDLLLRERPQIEREAGCELVWREEPNKKERRIKARKEKTNPAAMQEWDMQHEWMCRTLEALSRSVTRRIANRSNVPTSRGMW